MEFSSVFIFLLLIAAIASMALLANWLLWRQLMALEKQVDANSTAIAKEGQVSLLSHVSTDRKLQSIEQRVSRFTKVAMAVRGAPTAAPVENAKAAPVEASSEPNPINNAAKLIKEGVDANEVAKRCGLSQAEAELMVLMHERDRMAS